MPRNISFAMTTAQFRARSKTVTRRRGWKDLEPGTLLMGCRKCRGLKPGEKLERLGLIRVVSVRREPLSAVTAEDVAKEGYPGMTPEAFVAMFCRQMRCEPDMPVTRIEYEYVLFPEAHAS
jgi:hypothetical protein